MYKDVLAHKQSTQFEIKSLHDEIRSISQKNWLLRRILRTRERNLYRKIAQLKQNHNAFARAKQALIQQLHQDLQHLKNHPDLLIQQKVQHYQTQIDRLHEVQSLPVFAGALAEIKTIQHLQNLPDTYLVFNDVRLTASHYIRFDQQPLHSAQVDHIVLGPYGIFIIETKNWTRQFVAQGQYFDPYQQIRRANYLCYVLCHAKEKSIQIRNIIAYGNTPPNTTKTEYVKTLRIQELTGYIRWFEKKRRPMSNASFQYVTDTLRKFLV